MSEDQKEKYRQEIAMLKKLYPEFQKLVTQFGLDHYGSPAHSQMEDLLYFLRERNKELKERLE